MILNEHGRGETTVVLDDSHNSLPSHLGKHKINFKKLLYIETANTEKYILFKKLRNSLLGR